MQNVRGMFGKQVVFKNRLGVPYVAAPPYIKKNRIASESEHANRMSFAEAVEFGKKAIRDPQLKAEYASLAKPRQTPYNAAVSDARLPPKINSLLTQGYTGKIGSCILINATDNIKVKRVHIIIYNQAMELIEQGEAVDNGDNSNWIYSATVSAEDITGGTIEARAYDLAGNVALKTAEM